jgi:hypothetical protein
MFIIFHLGLIIAVAGLFWSGHCDLGTIDLLEILLVSTCHFFVLGTPPLGILADLGTYAFCVLE